MNSNRLTSTILILCMLLTTACSKAGAGAATGAGLGGTAGALLFKNKVLGASLGAGAGLILGYMAGNELDKADLAKIKDTVNTGRTGVPVSWSNPDTGQAYRATPGPVELNTDGLLQRNVDLMTPYGNIQHAVWVQDAWGDWYLAAR